MKVWLVEVGDHGEGCDAVSIWTERGDAERAALAIEPPPFGGWKEENRDDQHTAWACGYRLLRVTCFIVNGGMPLR